MVVAQSSLAVMVDQSVEPKLVEYEFASDEPTRELEVRLYPPGNAEHPHRILYDQLNESWFALP